MPIKNSSIKLDQTTIIDEEVWTETVWEFQVERVEEK